MTDSSVLEEQGEEIKLYLIGNNKQDTLTKRIVGDVENCSAALKDLQNEISSFHSTMAAKKEEVDNRIAAERAAAEKAASAKKTSTDDSSETEQEKDEDTKSKRKISPKNQAINMLE